MDNSFTIVTALFDLNREKMDGRTWDEYLYWFDETLKVKCPMVIFISEDLISFVEERRKLIPTEIIVQKKSEIPYFYLKDKLDIIIESQEYKNKISNPNRIECQSSMYSIIQYSKFKWLEQAISESSFNSKFFFWLDAGGSRFFDGYNLNFEYPSSNAKESLEEMGNKFLIQMNMEYYGDLVQAESLDINYLLDDRSYILGSMFGGTKNMVKKVSKDINNIFINEMISNNFVNNEQIALGYLIKQNPNDFEIFERYDGKHMALFTELGKQ